MAAPTIANSKASTATKYGGDALNHVNRYLNGVDITSQIGTPIIRTPTKIPSDKLIFTDPAEDNTVTVKIPVLSANKSINLVPTNVEADDEVLYKDTVQIISGKVISAGTNTISNIDTGNLAAAANIITTTNTKTMTNKTLTAPTISTISNTGTLTLPTGPTTLLGRDTSDTLTNKEQDYRLNTFKNILPSPLVKSVGRYDGIRGSGLLDDMTFYANNGGFYEYIFASTNDLVTKFNTSSTTANSVAGMRKSIGICRRVLNPVFRTIVRSGGGASNTKHFHGFSTVLTQLAGSLTNPFGNSDAGVMIGFVNGDTTFKVYYNDGGSAPPDPINTGVTMSVLDRIFEIKFNDSVPNCVWTIYDKSFTQLATGTITTDLPHSTTANMTIHQHVEGSAASSVNCYVLASEVLTR